MTTNPASGWPTANTHHGLLVAFGEFLQQHGLLDRLRQVPIKQKTRVYAPQTKLIELLAGIMSGLEHLEDLNDSAQPLAQDTVVAHAWGEPRFAHYSGVSRTLEVCDPGTVVAVEQAIRAFSRPFIDQAIQDVLRRGEVIVYDFDLTGQAVSPTSTTYPGAAFGWMDNAVKLGYQLARVSLSPAGGERIWLAGFHHPGDTVSVTCLKELVDAAEAQTQVRPRRRTELVQQRLTAQQTSITRTRRLIQQQQTKLRQLQLTQTELIGKCYHATQPQKGPISRQTKAFLKARLSRWKKRLPRLEAQLTKCHQVLAKHEAHLRQQEAVLAELQTWLAKLEADNRTNPDPPAYVEARMDAGFVSGEQLTWLLEMGYCPNTKAPNDQTPLALRKRLNGQTRWVRVGENAEMTAWGNYFLHDCPYPLTVALERFKVKNTYRYATLIHYRDDGHFPTLPAWFHHYNERQTIEAGNKEMKGTFFVQHLMSRSPAGIQLQVLFTGLAANAVRWCVPWLKSCAPEPTAKFMRTLNSPKHLVQDAAHAAARVERTNYGTALQFAPESCFPGLLLFLKGVPAFQLAFAFNQPINFASG